MLCECRFFLFPIFYGGELQAVLDSCDDQAHGAV